MKLGLCMEGLETDFIKGLESTYDPMEPFHYVEIGVCYCETIKAVLKHFKETNRLIAATGIDPSEIVREHWDKPKPLYKDFPWAYLENVTREEAFKNWHKLISFCLIDGCHSKKCVIADFLSVEPHVIPGGLVVFHDFEPKRVGKDFQPHCGEFEDVRGGVEELGLMDNARPGWKRLSDWKGDRERGGSDCGVFRKVLDGRRKS